MLADSEMIQNLLDSSLSGWKIEKETGVSRNAILEMRHGRRKIKNLRLETAIKLTAYASKKQNINKCTKKEPTPN